MDSPVNKPAKKGVGHSKTVQANIGASAIVSAIMEMSPAASQWIGAHPQTLLLGMAALNIVMRHFTAGGLTYKVTKQ